MSHEHDHSLSLSALNAKVASSAQQPECAPAGDECTRTAASARPTASASEDDGKSLWTKNLEANPGHSQWFIQRWENMKARGDDLDGEARFMDALLPRGARVFDAGSGTGRVGGELHRRGHVVVGIDLDPVLVEYAQLNNPGPTWIVGDLVDTLDLVGEGEAASFDAVISAGNVVTFPAVSHRERIMKAMYGLLKPGGRYVAGFGTSRGYSLDDYLAHATTAGFRQQQLCATWDMRPIEGSSPEYVVVILTK